MYFNFLVVASERHLTKRTGDYRRVTSFASVVFNMAARSPSRRLKGRVIIANKSIQMLEGIINTQPTSDVALSLVSTLETSLILTFVRHCVPCTQVDIGLFVRVDTRLSAISSFAFVYVHV